MLESNENYWDAVSGVTEGALNAYLVSLFDDPKASSEELFKFWSYLGEKDVYDSFSYGAIEGMMIHDSLYKSDPLMNILEEVFGNNTVHPLEEKNSKTKLNIGIANLHNGTFVSFNDNFKTKDLLHVLKASVSYPGIFEPHSAWDSEWFSGSAIWNLDVTSPVLRCKALGYKEKDIVMDVVLDNAPTIDTVDVSKYNTPMMGIRSLEVLHYFEARDGLLKAQRAYPDVTFRTVVGPS